MKFVNLGVLAHVDAGKTSLTERLLFNAGVIDHVGSVDTGDTQTDSLDLERQRGITIQSAVVGFQVGDLQVNLIDTPGHSDFVAEVERALSVLDGAVLVVSAVEGVQARTRILMRSLNKLRIPTLIFVNKIDRMGAREDDLVESIRAILAPNVVPLSIVTDIGTQRARSRPLTGEDFVEVLAPMLAGNNDKFLASYIEESLEPGDCEAELGRQVRNAVVYPVYFGSAVTGQGVPQLTDAIGKLLTPREVDSAHLSASVFKIGRGHRNDKVAYARLWSGTIARRDQVTIASLAPDGSLVRHSSRVTRVQVFERGAGTVDSAAEAGSIAMLSGLRDVRVGDQLGEWRDVGSDSLFAPPTLRTVIQPIDASRRAELFAALGRLAEQDPLVIAEQDELGAITVELFGEVQKEVIQAMLRDDFGIAVEFQESQTIYIERVSGKGEAFQEFDAKGPNFFWATIGLTIAPAAVGSGVIYEVGKLRGMLPLSFHKALEEGVRQTLRQGPLGWQVTDCRVSLTAARFQPPVSVAAHFRDLGALLTAEALLRAGTVVCEPVHRYELDARSDAAAKVLTVVTNSRGTVEQQTVSGNRCRVVGSIPASNVHIVARQTPELAHGEGTFATDFAGYWPVGGRAPRRSPVRANPYDRDQFMLYVLRSVT